MHVILKPALHALKHLQMIRVRQRSKAATVDLSTIFPSNFKTYFQNLLVNAQLSSVLACVFLFDVIEFLNSSLSYVKPPLQMNFLPPRKLSFSVEEMERVRVSLFRITKGPDFSLLNLDI